MKPGLFVFFNCFKPVLPLDKYFGHITVEISVIHGLEGEEGSSFSNYPSKLISCIKSSIETNTKVFVEEGDKWLFEAGIGRETGTVERDTRR